MISRSLILAAVAIVALTAAQARGQACGCGDAHATQDGTVARSPTRPADEGRGPFKRLILRGVTVVDGTGAPPRGPMDVVIEGNRIAEIRSVGSPGLPVEASRRPQAGPGDEVLELAGHYLLPGFVDMHGHMGGAPQGAGAEYVFKLWMGHGITTIRDPACGNGLDWALEHRERSARNEITAPRIHAYPVFGAGEKDPITTVAGAEAWVDKVKKQGADGVKFFGYRPDIMEAALRAIAEAGLRSACHHAQMDVSRV
ncbi:MAG: hypothetical protein KDB53_15785, partial [Planctomycetes bacterium]|nr:hypothetical protein [Planctomycetota bacterium]